MLPIRCFGGLMVTYTLSQVMAEGLKIVPISPRRPPRFYLSAPLPYSDLIRAVLVGNALAAVVGTRRVSG